MCLSAAGRTRIRLKRAGELFTHVPPNAKVHNIVLGRTWVDSFGTFYVMNVDTGAKCLLEFTPCGWFSAGRYEFKGYAEDANGIKKYILSGRWNSHVDIQQCDPEGEPLPGTDARRIWTCTPKPQGDWYGFTQFAHKLNGCDFLRRAPLASDSRRRLDRAALEKGDMGAAGSEKYRLEEAQRAEKRHRDAKGEGQTGHLCSGFRD